MRLWGFFVFIVLLTTGDTKMPGHYGHGMKNGGKMKAKKKGSKMPPALLASMKKKASKKKKKSKKM